MPSRANALPARILVVDDEALIRDTISEYLTQEGFAVFVDRFSVPVGVDFQERLMQELTDRGMVLLLHSPSVRKSRIF